jgi:tyrosyl-tRNA synthetase
VGAGPLGILAVLKQAGLAPSTSEAGRNLDQGGVRIDGEKVVDRGLQLGAGEYVVQVGKRRFAKVVIA